MKHSFNKTTVLSFLLCGVLAYEVSAENSSQITSEPHPSLPKSSAEVRPQPSGTPAPTEEIKAAPAEQIKTDEKPKAVTKQVQHKKKHKPRGAPAIEKTKPLAVETKAPETAAASTLSPNSGWFLGVRGSYVPGVIGELGYQFNATFKLRLIGAGFIRSYKSFSVDGQNYNKVRLKPLKVGLMADWHLWKNGFRLTGGIAYNRDRIHLNRMVTGTLLGQPAAVYGNIAANLRYRWAIAPYLGLGYDTGSLGNSGLSLSADAGFWFQGKVRSRVSLTGTGQNNDTVINSAKAHTENLINKNKMMRTVPMVSVGIRYMF
ncbi:MAG: hypothetical protein ACOH2E_05790 [Candidatus Paracaedibacter sp.]